jgi:hypothetical protein
MNEDGWNYGGIFWGVGENEKICENQVMMINFSTRFRKLLSKNYVFWKKGSVQTLMQFFFQEQLLVKVIYKLLYMSSFHSFLCT